MKIHRYILAVSTFLGVFAAIMLVGFFGGRHLLAYTEAQYVRVQFEANRSRAENAARMLEQYISTGEGGEEAVNRFQAAIEGTSSQKSFLCLIDHEGVLISHPDPRMIGDKKGHISFRHIEDHRLMTWSDAMEQRGAFMGILNDQAGLSQMVYAAPIRGTSWFASAHANTSLIEQEMVRLERTLTVSAAIMGLIMALAASLAARWVARGYERRIEDANRQLEIKVQERTQELQAALGEVRLAHDRLIRGEKMHLLGELMSGIAHEIRTPLSSMLSGAHVLTTTGDAKVKETAVLLRTAAERLSSIVDNMLAFARNEPPSRKTVELNNLCLSVIDLVASDLKHDNIELRQEFSTRVPPMELDAQQLQQVLLNLLSNARQALKGHEGEKWIAMKTWTDGQATYLDVEDSGPGIPWEHADEVFRPFYTTKETGTGLGLSLCRRFLEAHGAQLELVPSSGGAHFRITYPRSSCETYS